MPALKQHTAAHPPEPCEAAALLCARCMICEIWAKSSVTQGTTWYGTYCHGNVYVTATR